MTTQTWGGLLDLLCPLCAQVALVGLRGRACHDGACRSAGVVREVVDEARQDVQVDASARDAGPRSRRLGPSVYVRQLRDFCRPGIPLSTGVRRPGAGWALLGAREEAAAPPPAPPRSLTHWTVVSLSRGGLVPPGYRAALHAVVELARLRPRRLVVDAPGDLWIRDLRLAGRGILASSPHPGGGHPSSQFAEEGPTWLDEGAWSGPGALLTLSVCNDSPSAAGVSAVLYVDLDDPATPHLDVASTGGSP